MEAPIVLDNGTGVIKLGIAGEDKPQNFVANMVGRPKHQRVMPGGALEGGSVFIGRKVHEHRGAMLLSHPMDHGHVRDWGEMELVWRHCYEELCGGASRSVGDRRPLLLTVPPQTSSASQAALGEVLFESLRVPSLHLAPTSTLALYATGRTTGLVLECGEGVTAATPVYEGFSVPHAQVRCDYGGGEVTGELGLLLRRAGVALTTSSEREAVRALKEAGAYCALDPSRAEAGVRDGTAPVSEHVLPDGTRLKLGAELFRAPELLFNPSLGGLEAPGVAEAVTVAVARCDLDMRRALLGAIVVAGGSTAMKGFPQRLLADVRKAAPIEAKVCVWAPSDRKILTWVGGSILASLSTFKDIAVSKEEWEEEGPSALERRGAL